MLSMWYDDDDKTRFHCNSTTIKSKYTYNDLVTPSSSISNLRLFCYFFFTAFDQEYDKSIPERLLIIGAGEKDFSHKFSMQFISAALKRVCSFDEKMLFLAFYILLIPDNNMIICWVCSNDENLTDKNMNWAAIAGCYYCRKLYGYYNKNNCDVIRFLGRNGRFRTIWVCTRNCFHFFSLSMLLKCQPKIAYLRTDVFITK